MRTLYYNITMFIRNIKLFWKVLLFYRGGDYEYSLEVLKVCIQEMKKCQEEDVFASVNAEKYIKDMTVCIALIDRVVNDDYPCPKYIKWQFNGGGFDKTKTVDLPSLKTIMTTDYKQRDIDYLFKIIAKGITHWWT